MKRVLISILAFFYLSTSLGATLHLHYCMGKLVSWGFVSNESENCSFCGMPKKKSAGENQIRKNNCCKDDHKEIRTVGDQKSFAYDGQVQNSSFSAVLTHHFSAENMVSCLCQPHDLIQAHSKSDHQPVYLRNCNFRIWLFPLPYFLNNPGFHQEAAS